MHWSAAPITVYRTVFWVCLVLVLIPFTKSLIEFYFIIIVVSIIGVFITILFILNYMFRISLPSSSDSANAHLLWCFCSWAFPLNFGLNMLHSDSFVSSLDSWQGYSIMYRGVPGSATDFPCGVWCRGLTTSLLYVGPLFGNQVWNDSGLLSLTQWRITFRLFSYYFVNLIIMSQIVLYSLHSTLILSFYIAVHFLCNAIQYITIQWIRLYNTLSPLPELMWLAITRFDIWTLICL